jgi:hypothetical protein
VSADLAGLTPAGPRPAHGQREERLDAIDGSLCSSGHLVIN